MKFKYCLAVWLVGDDQSRVTIDGWRSLGEHNLVKELAKNTEGWKHRQFQLKALKQLEE